MTLKLLLSNAKVQDMISYNHIRFIRLYINTKIILLNMLFTFIFAAYGQLGTLVNVLTYCIGNNIAIGGTGDCT